MDRITKITKLAKYTQEQIEKREERFNVKLRMVQNCQFG